MDYDIAVIGGGAAGLTVAAGAGQLGAKTLLLEKAGRLGGDCLHVGCVPSKALIRTASLWAGFEETGRYGLPPVSRPGVDLGAVMDRVAGVIEKAGERDAPLRFERLGVDVRFSSPSFLDAHTVSVDGERISARSWVIATGSRPAVPPIPGLEATGFWTNGNVFSQRSLPGRLIVLGGGPIGLELAQAFSRLGSRVTVVEFLPRILASEDPDISGVLHASLESSGVELLVGRRVTGVKRVGAEVVATLADAAGNAAGEVRGDQLLLAAGRAPNVEGLNLEALGVAFDRRGIATDTRLRTSVRHIYACGDVNGKYPFTHVAGQEGSVALSNIIFLLPRRIDYARVPWIVYTDPEVAGIGLNEAEAVKAGLDFRVLEESFAENDRAIADGRVEGKIKILLTRRGKFLGCRIVGHRAGEALGEWIGALAGSASLTAMAQAMRPYPTYGEISRRAVGKWYAGTLFSAKMRRFLRIVRGFRGRGPTLED